MVKSGAGARRCHSADTKGQVASLVTAKLGKVRSSELAVEKAIELCILRHRLAVRDLQPVGLETVARCQDTNFKESVVMVENTLTAFLGC
jgi:hypothetical protein